jgi:adenylate cyclase
MRIKDLITSERSSIVISSLISLVATILLWALSHFGLLNILELKSLDFFQRHNPPVDNPGVVMVEVDQASLTGLSERGVQWPWPRQVYAPLIEACVKGGAKGIIFDIIFSEPSSYGVDDDLEFARAIKGAQNAFFPVNMSCNDTHKTDISPIQRFAIKGDASEILFREAKSYVPPIEEFVAGSKSLGDVIISPDSDGTYRRVPLFTRYKGYLFPSLAVSALKERFTLRGNDILFDAKPLPVNEKGELLLHYYGQGFQFPTFNVLDIVSAYQNPEGPQFDRVANRIRGRFVLFCLVAPGLRDLKPTSVTSQSPGGYIHGTLLANLLHGHHIRTMDDIWRVISIFILGIVLGLSILAIVSFWKNSLMVLLCMVGWALVSFGLFHYFQYWMGFLSPELSFLIIFGLAATYRYCTEGKRRRMIRRLFSQYMSEILVRELESHPEKAKLGGERRFITIFFSDLANFAGLSEQHEPEKIVSLLNDYFTEMSQIILDSKGIIDKYQGDSIMAFWGAPIPLQDHAVMACLAALACQRRMGAINTKLCGQGFPPLAMRIGIHSGEAIVGNMGSTQRFDYTVIGDNVNLASRLEWVNKQFGTEIIISEDTYQLAKERIEARELDLITVPGREKPIRVFQLLGEKDTITRDDKRVKNLFENGLKLYRMREFEKAQKKFAKAIEIGSDDRPSQIFVVRCRDLIDAPPSASWDGVFRLKEK